MTSIDGTSWELKKVMKKNTGLFVKKRKPGINEKVKYHFNHGDVTLVYDNDTVCKQCTYYYMNKRKQYFMHFRINCGDSIAYDWTVYRLSLNKLVAAIFYVDLRDKLKLPIFLGRNIFYKAD